MLKYFIKLAIGNYIPNNKTNIEEYLYNSQVYPTYLVVRSHFRDAMHSKQLHRQDILTIKKMLDKALFKHRHLSDYKSYKFKNDAHEIYKKLQSKYLSKKQLLKIDKYIINVVASQSYTQNVPSSEPITQP